MLIQIILIVAIVVIGFLVIRNPGSDSHLAIRRLLLFAFVIVAVLSVLFPQWLSWVASLIGVGRGTDLLLYALVLVVLVVIATQYRTNVEQNRRITQLARRIALLEARESERQPSVQDDSAAPPHTEPLP
ncbi:DUF2304 domain-containing protein [Microbacterium sp. zg.B48]|uniref:DUF2304 domain-containing protein n=1 Tax=Microbacterium sp. zg.B48 TaxID=2969408 RepID=UPI00214B1FCE|nr:DUF2304 domain-containing protein [Microbacterium sp. zg.B48]MCR2765122.1 DUF2304 domain-containing protein [Microbacterium sp. zg.B48]